MNTFDENVKNIFSDYLGITLDQEYETLYFDDIVVIKAEDCGDVYFGIISLPYSDMSADEIITRTTTINEEMYDILKTGNKECDFCHNI